MTGDWKALLQNVRSSLAKEDFELAKRDAQTLLVDVMHHEVAFRRLKIQDIGITAFRQSLQGLVETLPRAPNAPLKKEVDKSFQILERNAAQAAQNLIRESNGQLTMPDKIGDMLKRFEERYNAFKPRGNVEPREMFKKR